MKLSTHSRYLYVRGRAIPWYAAMLYVGLVAALIVADFLARRSGLAPQRVVFAMAVSIPAALAGARLLIAAYHWRAFRERPGEILAVQRGGAVMYGGLLPAFLVSVPLVLWLDLPLRRFWDIAVVAILVGMVPTRFGCLKNGCCAGRRARGPLTMRLPNAAGVVVERVPNQILEAALGGASALLCIAVWDRLSFDGAAALLGIAAYASGRFALEWLREDRGPLRAGLGPTQWISLGLVALAAGGLGLAELARSESAREAITGSEGLRIATLLASSALLAPVMILFRFLGCTFEGAAGPSPDPVPDPPPQQELILQVRFPDPRGNEPITATMTFVSQETAAEIEGSPFDLRFKSTEADGRLLYEETISIPEDGYDVTCDVGRPDGEARQGACSGDLNGPGLGIGFFATEDTTPAGVLEERLCFDPFPTV